MKNAHLDPYENLSATGKFEKCTTHVARANMAEIKAVEKRENDLNRIDTLLEEHQNRYTKMIAQLQ
jgi:hypothetical protein